ncbi:MAG TPA: VOC family protein [Bryobacteraceae bacterium]|nr:VOC family protein [Bryobacteraceae bacterium]
MELSRIGVVMLGVHEIARSIAVYRDRLGLKLQNQMPGFAFFDAGGVTLCISEPLAKASGRIVGATEVVFSVSSVRGAYSALLSRGITFSHEPRNVAGTSWAANFNDPDGHRLSIFGPEGSEHVSF